MVILVEIFEWTMNHFNVARSTRAVVEHDDCGRIVATS
jgi:hypothetical protein